MYSIEAVFAGGVFRPLASVPTAENQRVLLTVVSSPPAPPPRPISTAGDLLSSGIAGMWADREDMKDSQAFARRLRQDAETRRGSNDHAAR